MISLKRISHEEFLKHNVPLLFKNQLTNRVYGILSNGKVGYKLGWQSDLISPIIKQLFENQYAVGIDLNFVIFDFLKKKLFLNLDLSYFFLDIKLHRGFVLVITELEIYKIAIEDYEVLTIVSLPDYFESIQFKEDIISVTCTNSQQLKI